MSVVSVQVVLWLLVLAPAEMVGSFFWPPAGPAGGVVLDVDVTTVVVVVVAALVGVTEVAVAAATVNRLRFTVFDCRAATNRPALGAIGGVGGRRGVTKTFPCPYRRSTRRRGSRSDGAG